MQEKQRRQEAKEARGKRQMLKVLSQTECSNKNKTRCVTSKGSKVAERDPCWCTTGIRQEAKVLDSKLKK